MDQEVYLKKIKHRRSRKIANEARKRVVSAIRKVVDKCIANNDIQKILRSLQRMAANLSADELLPCNRSAVDHCVSTGKPFLVTTIIQTLSKNGIDLVERKKAPKWVLKAKDPSYAAMSWVVSVFRSYVMKTSRCSDMGNGARTSHQTHLFHRRHQIWYA